MKYFLYGFCLVLIAVIAPTAFSQDDYWRSSGLNCPSNVYYSDPTNACNCANLPTQGYVKYVSKQSYNGGTRYRCYYSKFSNGTAASQKVTAYKVATCPAGQIFDDALQSCRSDCPAGQQYDPLAESCTEVCPGQQQNPWNGQCETCPNDVWNNDTQTCAESQCLGNEMSHIEDGSTIPCTGSGCADLANDKSVTTGCTPTDGCTNITGKSNYDPNFDYCQESQNECELAGGTYGSMSRGGDSLHAVCLYPQQPGPTCSSSGQWHAVENSDGSYAMACESTTPPDYTCDATRFDCDQDGNVDDQDNDGVVDNGTANEHELGNAPNIIEIPFDPNAPINDGTNIWGDPLNTPVVGAGQCDPTSRNYQECINSGSTGELPGQGLSEQQAFDLADISGSNSQILEALTSNGTPVNPYSEAKTLEASSGDYYTSLSSVPIVAGVGNVANAFSGSGACPAPSFDAFDANFTLDYHCTLYGEISGIMSAMMLVLWTLVGIRHVVSA